MSFGNKTQRLGTAGYARLLRAVVTPRTPAQAASLAGMKRSTAAMLLREFVLQGIAHVTGWTPSNSRPSAPWVPICLAGPGENVDPPVNVRHAKRRPRLLCLEFCRLTRIVMEAPLTVQQLADEAGIQDKPADCHLRAMRRNGLLFVADWDTSGHRPTRMWGWGPGKHSAKRPGSLAGVTREWSQHRRARIALQALRGQGCGGMVAGKVAGATMDERRAA